MHMYFCLLSASAAEKTAVAGGRLLGLPLAVCAGHFELAR